MAQRDDIDILWYLSPRIIVVRAPSTELTIQDLHDTCRELEARAENLIYEQIIATAGKEELGGGVSVGLTTTLQNAKIAFEARKISVSNGLVTADDLTGKILTDATADFIADGVAPGASITNFTDESIASVILVLNSTQLLTDLLADGYDNQFEIGDRYKVLNTIQMNISGGNVVAIDGYGDPISPVLPTAGTQIVRTSSSSATISDIESLQISSFFGGVSIDVTSTYSGVVFPVGTAQQPVNNFVDAISIANTRGLKTLFLSGTAIASGINLSGLTIQGTNAASTVLVVLPGVSTNATSFSRMSISGVLDGYVVVEESGILDITGNNITIRNSLLLGAISIVNADIPVSILDCWSGIPGPVHPIIDLGGSGSSLGLRNYYGGVDIRNKTGPEPMSINMSAGTVVLDSSVTDGVIVASGVGLLVNNSTGTTVVDTVALNNPGTISNATLKKTLPFLDE